MTSRARPTLALTAAQLKATEARDAERRDARVPVASSSVTPVRCATCGEWNARENWNCRVCGIGMTRKTVKRVTTQPTK